MTTIFTAGEKGAARHLLYHVGHPDGCKPGSFTSSLITCLERADPANRVRLLNAFPVYLRPLNLLQWLGQDALADALKVDQ